MMKLKVSPFYKVINNKLMSETKTIELTIGERLAALKIFDLFKGSMVTMKALLDDVKQLPMTEEEWTKANLVKTPVPGTNGQPESEQWKWDEVVKKEVTLQSETVEYLKAQIKSKSDAGEVTLSDVALVSLNDKI
jgi:hypothetical protein